jgi:hypothetical protein
MIISELTDKDIIDIDMRYLGKIIHGKAFALSKKVNTELLEPISKWLDNPDWMKRFRVYEDNTPNWANYKRRQRRWTKQQKAMARERLKLYWQEIRKKRTFRSEFYNIKSGASPRGSPQMDITSYFLTPIIAPFSPKEQRRAETNLEFQQGRELSISNLLPWQVLIASEFNSKDLIKLTELKTYAEENPKSDTVAKLQHLLQMETEGKIALQQAEPYGEISIASIDPDQESSIIVKDQSGRHYDFDWCDLSDAQRNKVIADIKSNKILCKTT